MSLPAGEARQSHAPISFDVARALIILRRNTPYSFQQLVTLKRYAYRVVVPPFVMLMEADHWEMIAEFASLNPGHDLPKGLRWAFITMYRDIANTWRCRAPSRQLTHDLGAAA
ncbi:MAG: hypothetical protein ABF562_03240 [Gluconobacter japonicus]|uniref:hypothetical protein n=1 Tax=Gluconobacter japonicus TaxID=376620 RepID=UPI0039E7F65E